MSTQRLKPKPFPKPRAAVRSGPEDQSQAAGKRARAPPSSSHRALRPALSREALPQVVDGAIVDRERLATRLFVHRGTPWVCDVGTPVSRVFPDAAVGALASSR